MNPFELLRQAHDAKCAMATRLAPLGLTVAQYRLIELLPKRATWSFGDLAVELRSSRGNLTGIADRLERDGVVVRERSKDDRRVVRVVLTSKGQRVLDEANLVAGAAV